MPFSPGQVAAMLDIPPSTLRFWARRFEKQLSPHKSGSRRVYSERDVVTFRQIKELSAEHIPLEQIESRLQVEPTQEEREETRREVSALSLVPAISAALEDLSSSDRELRQLLEQIKQAAAAAAEERAVDRARIEALEKRIDELTARRPWYKRLFGK